MTGLPFPCDENNPTLPPGHPFRAHPCACVGGPVLFDKDDRCHRCGRYPVEEIQSTWLQRAEQVARIAEGRRMREARRRRRRT